MKRLLAALALSALLLRTAHAEPGAATGAEQMAGLFVQSCMRFAGDVRGLRQWIADARLSALPQPGQEAFLNGRPGIVFDATNGAGKFALISGDDGSCAVVAQIAHPASLVATFERLLRPSGVTLELAGERIDPEEKALRWRDYRAAKGPRRWSIAVGTASDSPNGMAMLSARP
jgi:hypothetical protein